MFDEGDKRCPSVPPSTLATRGVWENTPSKQDISIAECYRFCLITSRSGNISLSVPHSNGFLIPIQSNLPLNLFNITWVRLLKRILGCDGRSFSNHNTTLTRRLGLQSCLAYGCQRSHLCLIRCVPTIPAIVSRTF